MSFDALSSAVSSALHETPLPTTSDAITYVASPTISQFHRDSSSFIRVILGSVGGGKTIGCLMEVLIKAFAQEPYKGLRRTRWAIVRSTYPELKNTTLKSFQAWVPERMCHVNMQPPFSGMIKQDLEDGTKVECEIIFLALDQPDDVKKLKSIEFTGIFINEVRYCDETIFQTCKERVGRYPEMKPDEGFFGASWSGIVADTNAWATTHWLYEMFDKGDVLEGHRLYEQPPAIFWVKNEKEKSGGHWEVNPDAENLRFLPANYYSRQLIGGKDDILRVELGLERGISRQGKPVFPNFSEKLHVSPKPLVARRGLPLVLGFDWGLNPGCVFSQFHPGGFIHLLEALSPSDESLEEFLDNYVIPLLNKKYQGYKITGVGDPSGGRSKLVKATPYSILGDRGIKCQPAATNKFVVRKESVDWFLDRHKLLIDPSLTVLREGFAGGYHYAEIQNNKGMFKEEPVKNAYSHCFVASTPVSTPLGEIAIGDLQVGDLVDTPIGARQVTAIWSRQVSKIVEVSLSNGRSIFCTPNHPFITARGLVRADELQYTDVLFQNMLRNKHAVSIVGVRSVEPDAREKCEGIMVHDITVDGAHCFYAQNILVHNSMDATQYICLYAKYGFRPSSPTDKAKEKGFRYA